MIAQNKRNMNIKVFLSFFIGASFILLSTGLSSCNDDPEQVLPDREYELVWSDDFNGDTGTSLNTSLWNFDIGKGANGWGNGELQSYTDDLENVALDGKGNLVISARKNSNGSYTSARIKTEGIFTQQYGRIEARIKTPAGQGIWPAFWMLGENIDQVGWPECGEIDIMEQKGQYPFITYGSLHGPGYSAGNAITNSYRLETGRFDTEFYLYAVEWGEDYVDFFLNDILYKSIKRTDVPGDWVYNQPFFIILNVAVGGTFVGLPNDNTPFPASMYIDYVKVYKEI
ncbi:glycoside hydrolase family 16 protein [bacterium]|nr:glycoside hydrolase family 16 protein [bacterium]